MSEEKRTPGLPTDSTESVRRVAERELAEGRSAWLIEIVLDRVGVAPSWDRAQVLKGLSQVHGVERLLAPLSAALREPADAARRNAARSVLATLAAPESTVAEHAIEVLGRDAREADDADHRILAVSTIGDAANPIATPYLLPLLDDQDENLAAAAAEALGESGDARAIEPLMRAATDGGRWVRLAAIAALGRIGDARAVPALRPVPEDSLLTKASLAALAEIASPAALPLLRGPAESDDTALAGAAWRACAAILAAHPEVEPPDWLRTAVAPQSASLSTAFSARGEETSARLLGIAGTEDASDALFAGLERERTEPAALAGLRLLPAERLATQVLDRLAGPSEHRPALLAALPSLEAESARRLLPLLADADAGVRAAAADALVRCPEDVARDLLVEALSEPARRAPAARALGRLPHPPCEELAHLLDDVDPDVRAAAGSALDGCDASSARDAVLKALEREHEPFARAALLGALGSAGGEEAVARLAKFLDSDSAYERFQAARALGHTGLSSALPPLLRALADPAPEVQAAALRSLGLLGDPRAAEPLAAGLDRPDTDLRRTAASALQHLAAPEAMERLGRALDDPDWEIRLAAVRTLRNIGSEEWSERFRFLRDHDPDPLVRSAAAAALGGFVPDGGA